ncbi:transferase hexapeptide (six repeat-containing protein) [Oceanobacillus limi]|uniref:Transferase hexapeptide (Six repeat-containing protein) n=1 Tax=Oceanobacillus limi TaxID=930131 RepID=A0A1I0H2Q9_9BACI|nr:N-acetyltransferase [Oceanobacillus limi]SET77086.1 transferase hexapeptide (six repeat-containing protein) [Oceanobacillus limi]
MIHDTVTIGDNTKIGEQVIIERNVCIGDNVTIGNHVIIKENTRVGDYVTIDDLSVIGKTPSSNQTMARKPGRSISPLVIHEHVNVGCSTVLYKGSTIHQGVFIGDLSSVRENVSIGENSIVGRGAMVEMNTIIGKHVTIQTGAYITADMIIEDYVFIGPCFSSSNDKYMGEGNYKHQGPIIKSEAKIGNNATLLPGITIGRKAVIGAGAVVTKDVLDSYVVVGSPARKIDYKTTTQE